MSETVWNTVILRHTCPLLKQRLLSTYERAVGFASKSRKFRRNLSLTEMRIVRSLRASRELVIKPADKNLGLCVMSIDWYRDEGYRQLRDGNYERPGFSMARMLSKIGHVPCCALPVD